MTGFAVILPAAVQIPCDYGYLQYERSSLPCNVVKVSGDKSRIRSIIEVDV